MVKVTIVVQDELLDRLRQHVEEKYGMKRALSTFIQEAIKEKLEKEGRSERSKRNSGR